MERIEKMNGYVYLVEGEDGFETYHNLGKDPDSDIWKKEENEELKKSKTTKKRVKK